jgi:hypothetical protein
VWQKTARVAIDNKLFEFIDELDGTTSEVVDQNSRKRSTTIDLGVTKIIPRPFTETPTTDQIIHKLNPFHE